MAKQSDADHRALPAGPCQGCHGPLLAPALCPSYSHCPSTNRIQGGSEVPPASRDTGSGVLALLRGSSFQAASLRAHHADVLEGPPAREDLGGLVEGPQVWAMEGPALGRVQREQQGCGLATRVWVSVTPSAPAHPTAPARMPASPLQVFPRDLVPQDGRVP